MAETPRGFRRVWAAPYRSSVRDGYPHLHFIGVKGRVGQRFFDLSLGTGKKLAKCHPNHHAEAWRRGYEPRVEFGWTCHTCGAEGKAFSATAAENYARDHSLRPAEKEPGPV